MKYFVSLFFLLGFSQSLYSQYYVDGLDTIIGIKIAALRVSSHDVEKIALPVQSYIASGVPLQEIEAFLDHKNAIDFFCCNQKQLKPAKNLTDEDAYFYKNHKDLQSALGAKLYMYYLECAQQKMMHKAVKNYSTLTFWQNEKFAENQPFYKTNLLRCLSGEEYQERIERNIKELEKLTQQTNYFLGLILKNKQVLSKAETQQEFEQLLIQAVRLQDDFLHAPHDRYQDFKIDVAIKKSIDQLSTFSLYISQQYAQCKLPSHIVRNWDNYTLASVAACACAFMYVQHGEEILQGSQYFWDEHIQGSLTRTVNILSGYTQAPQLDTEKHCERIKELVEAGVKKAPARGEDIPLHLAVIKDLDNASNGESSTIIADIDAKKKDVDHIRNTVMPFIETIDYVQGGIVYFVTGSWVDYNQTLWINWNGSAPRANVQSQELDTMHEDAQLLPMDQAGESLQDTIRQYLDQLDENLPQNTPVITQVEEQAPDTTNWTYEEKKEYYEKELNIIKANPFKNILRIGEPVDYKIEEESMQSKDVANKFAKDVHVLLSVTALIPLMTVVGGSLFASKTLYNSVAYQPVRTLVRQLEILLNESFHQTPSLEREGYIYFLTEQLKLKTSVLTIPEQKLIEDDIAALQSTVLDYGQKFNVIQRMYRTYPCLVPGRI